MTANNATSGGLRFKLRNSPKTRLNLSAIVPQQLADQTLSAIEKIGLTENTKLSRLATF